jgi:hypothetical protein
MLVASLITADAPSREQCYPQQGIARRLGHAAPGRNRCGMEFRHAEKSFDLRLRRQVRRTEGLCSASSSSELR